MDRLSLSGGPVAQVVGVYTLVLTDVFCFACARS
jgi:hypothetical protein